MARERAQSLADEVEITDPEPPVQEPLHLNGVPDASPIPPSRMSAAEEEWDPFDPARLRLPPDFSAALGVKRALLQVPVRRPAKEWFVRIHPDPSYHLHTALIELRESREIYLVAPHLWPTLAAESTFAPKMLFLTVNRQHTPFFWPVRLPGPDGRVDTWSQSALEAAQMAMHTWVRVAPDMSVGGYNVLYADHATSPVWPELSMRELLRIAFKDHCIDTLEHPVLRQLRGEV